MATSAPAPVTRLFDAVNADDTAAFIDCFSTTASLDDWGRIFSGHENIRGWSDNEFIGKNARLSIYSIVNVDNRTVIVAEMTSTGFNGPSTFSFTVDGDSISSMTIRA